MGTHTDESRIPVVTFDEAKALAEKHGTPILACSLERVKENYKRLRRLLPRFKLYYAVKANPLPDILKTLAGMGSCFDVASKNEIQMCLDAGAKPDNLLYANPVKPKEHLIFARDAGITACTFDNPNELDKIAKYAPEMGVVLRLVVKDVGSFCKFSTKFGAREKQAMALLEKAKELGLKPTGLSFHVGSQCTKMENFSRALDICARIQKRAAKAGIELKLIDTGGGIPIQYTREIYALEELTQMMNEKLDMFAEGTEFIAEPGRAIAGDSMTLITRVIGTARRNNNDCIYIDDGCYNSLSERIFGRCKYRFLSDRKGELKSYTVFGPTCDSVDVISRHKPLPEVKEDDLLLILSTGAYSNAAATHFNGFDPAKIIFV